ncbi:MAG: hypothetical protein IJW22_02250 [Clostridia bacterium]|nr:hypothetical protein [Clostridia bacterium]
MFGYVKTERGELRVREYEYYRALYCGLCHSMGKCTGHCSRACLSYDFVFLAAVRLALTGERVELKKQSCFLHPFRKRWTVQPCQALDFCADASALLVYHKLADDISDERGAKRLRARLGRCFFRYGFQKARGRYPALEQSIATSLADLSRDEKSEALTGADQPASRFGALMEAVLCEGLPEKQQRIAAVIGRAIGRWIYLVDAADDYREDCKKGRFNPYKRLYPNGPSEGDVQGLCAALTALLADAEQGVLLLEDHPSPELRGIIYNVLYLGLPQAAKSATAAMLQEKVQKNKKQ